MIGRLTTAVVAGSVVVALGVITVQAAGGAASGPSRERASDAKLDHPHQVRPVAAPNPATLRPFVAALQEMGDVSAIARLHDVIQLQNLQVWFATVAANQAHARAATVRRTRTRGPVVGARSDAPDGVLACIRHRESRGDYGVVNRSSGAAGAYQFMPGTWNNNARSAGRTDLVGVSPAQASQADQDAMAQHLLATQGLRPWGGGCH